MIRLKASRRWGDRRGLNPQPPVPQTTARAPEWRFLAILASGNSRLIPSRSCSVPHLQWEPVQYEQRSAGLRAMGCQS